MSVGLFDLKAAGFKASDLKASGGFEASKLKAVKFTAADLKAAAFTAAELKASGFNAAELKAAGFNVAELKAAGFTATDLRLVGLGKDLLTTVSDVFSTFHGRISGDDSANSGDDSANSGDDSANSGEDNIIFVDIGGGSEGVAYAALDLSRQLEAIDDLRKYINKNTAQENSEYKMLLAKLENFSKSTENFNLSGVGMQKYLHAEKRSKQLLESLDKIYISFLNVKDNPVYVDMSAPMMTTCYNKGFPASVTLRLDSLRRQLRTLMCELKDYEGSASTRNDIIKRITSYFDLMGDNFRRNFFDSEGNSKLTGGAAISDFKLFGFGDEYFEPDFLTDDKGIDHRFRKIKKYSGETPDTSNINDIKSLIKKQNDSRNTYRKWLEEYLNCVKDLRFVSTRVGKESGISSAIFREIIGCIKELESNFVVFKDYNKNNISRSNANPISYNLVSEKSAGLLPEARPQGAAKTSCPQYFDYPSVDHASAYSRLFCNSAAVSSLQVFLAEKKKESGIKKWWRELVDDQVKVQEKDIFRCAAPQFEVMPFKGKSAIELKTKNPVEFFSMITKVAFDRVTHFTTVPHGDIKLDNMGRDGLFDPIYKDYDIYNFRKDGSLIFAGSDCYLHPEISCSGYNVCVIGEDANIQQQAANIIDSRALGLSIAENFGCDLSSFKKNDNNDNKVRLLEDFLDTKNIVADLKIKLEKILPDEVSMVNNIAEFISRMISIPIPEKMESSGVKMVGGKNFTTRIKQGLYANVPSARDQVRFFSMLSVLLEKKDNLVKKERLKKLKSGYGYRDGWERWNTAVGLWHKATGGREDLARAREIESITRYKDIEIDFEDCAATFLKLCETPADAENLGDEYAFPVGGLGLGSADQGNNHASSSPSRPQQ